MNSIAFIFLTMSVIFFLGFIFGKLSNKTPYSETIPDLNELDKSELSIDMDKLPVWDVVRYHNDMFDCVWSGNHTRREAEKVCKKLNNDYHRNYGEYRVENSRYSKNN